MKLANRWWPRPFRALPLIYDGVCVCILVCRFLCCFVFCIQLQEQNSTAVQGLLVVWGFLSYCLVTWINTIIFWMPLHFSRTVFPLLWGTVENSLYVIVYFPDSISEWFAVSKLAWLCYYDNKWTKMLTWLFGTLIGGLFRIWKDIK